MNTVLSAYAQATFSYNPRKVRMRNMTDLQFKKLLCTCLIRMREENMALFDRNLKEECLNAAFCMILKEEFSIFPKLKKLGYDIEYDKLGRGNKAMEDLGLIRPDILVHRRGKNTDNFLFIEAKKVSATQRDKDKLKKAICPPYSYRFAVAICYGIGAASSRFAILSRSKDQETNDLTWEKV